MRRSTIIMCCVALLAWGCGGGESAGSPLDSQDVCEPTVDGRILWCNVHEHPQAVAVGPNGVVYLVASGNLEARDSTSGSLRWTYSGNCSKPAVGPDGTVYVPCLGFVAALHPSNGVEKWRFQEGGAKKSPLVANSERVYVAGDALYAVDSTDGTLLWSFPEGNGETEPALGIDGSVYVVGSHGLHAIEPSDGSLRWVFDPGCTIDNPTADAYGTVYAPASNDVLYALDASDGSELWNSYAGNWYSYWRATPGPDGAVYYPVGTAVIALDSASGQKLWTFDSGSGPSIYPIAIASDGTVVAPGKSEIYGLDPIEGALLWTFQIDLASFKLVSADENNQLYVPTSSGVCALRNLRCDPCEPTCRGKHDISRCLPDGSGLSDEVEHCDSPWTCVDGQCH